MKVGLIVIGAVVAVVAVAAIVLYILARFLPLD